MKPPELRLGWIFGGLFVGLMVTGFILLFRSPRTGDRESKNRFDKDNSHAVTSSENPGLPNPIDESIVQGRAAARRRLDDLGLNR
jgi:hypothetical protein